MIVAAALPLVAESGATVTTSQIARAAGIGEATIFRAFADKDEVLAACVAEAARPDHVLRELASISPDLPLAARLVDAVDAVRGHLGRLGAVAGALVSSGYRRWPDRSEHRPGAREESVRVLRDAIADLVEPDQGSLRFPARQVASIFLGLVFVRDGDEAELDQESVVDILLHGAAA